MRIGTSSAKVKGMKNDKGELFREREGECVFLGWISQYLQSQGQSLLIPSTFNLGDPDPSVPCLLPPPSSMQAMNKIQLLTCLSSPPGQKKKSPERSFALKSPELLTTNGCKRLQRAAPLQHTNDRMHAGGPGPGRKEKGGCGIFAIRWRARQECSSPMHSSDHRMLPTIVTRLQSLFQVVRLVEQMELSTEERLKDRSHSQILKTGYQLLSQQWITIVERDGRGEI